MSSDHETLLGKTIKTIFLLLLLCGCANEKNISCSRFDGDDSVILNINALNDDIRTIEVTEIFALPEETQSNEKFYSDLKRQLDLTCHIEGNRLVRRYALALDRTYSLQLTIEDLRKEKFFCE